MDRTILKQRAKESLKDNVGIALLAVLVCSALETALGFTMIGIVLMGVIEFGLTSFFVNLSRYNKASLEQVFDGFSKNFINSMVAGLLQYVFIFLWSLLLIIPGIIKSYSYAMTYYIMQDNPNIDGSQAIEESKKMMHGHKAELFILDLSFIGWHLLAMLTFGLLYIWLTPYIMLTRAHFYNELKAKNGDPTYIEAEVITDTSNL